MNSSSPYCFCSTMSFSFSCAVISSVPGWP